MFEWSADKAGFGGMLVAATKCCDLPSAVSATLRLSGIEDSFARFPGYRSPGSLDPGLMAAIPSGSVVCSKHGKWGHVCVFKANGHYYFGGPLGRLSNRIAVQID